MSIYTEQDAFQFLERIAVALEKIEKWLELEYSVKPVQQLERAQPPKTVAVPKPIVPPVGQQTTPKP